MTKLVNQVFKGSIPRVEPHLLPEGAAQVALNCRLWHGSLEAWRNPKYLDPNDENLGYSSGILAAYAGFHPTTGQLIATWAFNKFAILPHQGWVVFVPPGGGGIPRVDLGNNNFILLSVGCPTEPPQGVINPRPGAPSVPPEDTSRVTRVYAYTFVDQHGQESSLSPPSEPFSFYEDYEYPDFNFSLGSDPTLYTGMKIRFYVAASGHLGGGQPLEGENHAWLRTDITTGVLDYQSRVDATVYWRATHYLHDLYEALEYIESPPAPETCRVVEALVDQNVLAAASGNKIFFTEAGRFHSWPHEIHLEDNVCGMVYSDGFLYVATDGSPYVISAQGDCVSQECREVVRLSEGFARAGCYRNVSIVAVPGGAVYVGQQGLVYLSKSNVPKIITEGLYSPEDWSKIRPEILVLGIHHGYLIAMNHYTGFALRFGREGWDLDTHTELYFPEVMVGSIRQNGFRDVKLFNDRSGNLFISTTFSPQAGGFPVTSVYQWDAGKGRMEFVWRSPEFTPSAPVNFAAGYVHHEQAELNIKITVDRKEVLSRNIKPDRGTFRLPRWAFGNRWQYELRGSGKVKLFTLATSMKDLR